MSSYTLPHLRHKKTRTQSLPSTLGPPRGYRKIIEPHTLGKRPLLYRYTPKLEDERPTASKYAKVHPTEDSQEDDASTKKEPWHQKDPFVRKLDPAEMRLLTEPTSRFLDSQPFGNDTCPIHPIFHSLTNHCTAIPLLVPVLRLATRFLLCTHTLPFFHTLLTSDPTVLEPESAFYQTWITNLEPSVYQRTGLLQAERLKTMEMFVALKHHISIRISPDPRLATRWAYTERYTPPRYPTPPTQPDKYANLPAFIPVPADFHAPNPPAHPSPQTQHLLNPTHPFTGTNAIINLSSTFLTLLHPYTHLTTSTAPTDAQLLRGMFFFSLTLLHELAHAIWMTRFPPPTTTATTTSTSPNQNKTQPLPEYEPFYSHHRTPELGHALETTWFSGGKILSLAEEPLFRIGLGWQRWPSTSDFHVQNHRGEVVPLARLSGVETGNLSRVKPKSGPKWATVYVLSHMWVKKFFYEEFWEAFDRAGGFRGVDLMEGQKELGVRHVNWGFGLEVNVDSNWGLGDGMDTGCSSRGRWPDSAGVVRLGQVESEVRDDMLEFRGDEDEEEEEW